MSQWGFLDPAKTAYNQSRMDIRLKLTDSALNWVVSMDQYAGSPGHSTYCYKELAASFINFLQASSIKYQQTDKLLNWNANALRYYNASTNH